MPKPIRIKNDLPELLSAVCNHPDCPEWLQDAIWEAMNNRCTFDPCSIEYFRLMVENIKAQEPDTDRESFEDVSDVLNSEVLQ